MSFYVRALCRSVDGVALETILAEAKAKGHALTGPATADPAWRAAEIAWEDGKPPLQLERDWTGAEENGEIVEEEIEDFLDELGELDEEPADAPASLAEVEAALREVRQIVAIRVPSGEETKPLEAAMEIAKAIATKLGGFVQTDSAYFKATGEQWLDLTPAE